MFDEVIIGPFKGEYDFLSNFFYAPLVWENVKFDTSEHAYQWAKTFDPVEKDFILFETSFDGFKVKTKPGKAKRNGRKVTLREDWELIKLDIMYSVLKAKFEQNPFLKQKLLDTNDDILIEYNTWCDNIFGDCTCPKCVHIQGQNYLGKLLMQLREEFRNARS